MWMVHSAWLRFDYESDITVAPIPVLLWVNPGFEAGRLKAVDGDGQSPEVTVGFGNRAKRGTIRPGLMKQTRYAGLL